MSDPQGMDVKSESHLGTFESLRYLGRGHGQIAQPDSNGLIDGVGERSWRRDDRDLTDAADSIGVSGVRDFHDNGLNHWQVQAGGHAIVQKTGVQHLTRIIVNIFLIESPANALHDATLHLPFNIAGVNRFPGILNSRVPKDRDFACFGVHFNVRDMGRKSSAYCMGGYRDARSDVNSLLSEGLRQALESDGLGAVSVG